MGHVEKGWDLKVSLDESDPEIWRSLLVPADIPLSQLHRVIQTAFGWENRHLYQFCVGGGSNPARVLMGDRETAEEMQVELAADFTLGQVIGPETTRLEYEYDFGDSWNHTITVLRPALAQQGGVICTGGARRGPLEDAGGIWGYQEKCRILADPKHPDYEDVSDWYAMMAPDDPQPFDPERFSLDTVNQRLERLGRVLGNREATPEEKAAVVRPVQWLLQRVGAEGLELTKDGYLKPPVVEETMRALSWEKRWYGKFNRESQTRPVLDLREHCQQWKLLRKYKGRLVLTPAGRRMVHDAGALWDHLAERLAHPGTGAEELVCSVLVRWWVDDVMPAWTVQDRVLADILTGAGFRMADGGRVTEESARDLYLRFRWALQCLNIPDSYPAGLTRPKVTGAGLEFLLELRRRQEPGFPA